MKGAFVLLASLLSIVASEEPGPNPYQPMSFLKGKGAIEAMVFGTIDEPTTFHCGVKGCKWSDHVVHKDWMFYGAGIGNPEAMNPIICAQRCALDINCGAFEYDITKKGTNYCSWWSVGVCDQEGHGSEAFQTCAKKDACVPYSESACREAAIHLGLELGGEGYDFTGGSEDYEKGCYTYNEKTDLGDFTGRVYYGTGGTPEQMQAPLDPPKYRPQGHDCSGPSGSETGYGSETEDLAYA